MNDRTRHLEDVSPRGIIAIAAFIAAGGAALRACGWAARATGCVVVGTVSAAGWALERAARAIGAA
jgi:hypothetical protein